MAIKTKTRSKRQSGSKARVPRAKKRIFHSLPTEVSKEPLSHFLALADKLNEWNKLLPGPSDMVNMVEEGVPYTCVEVFKECAALTNPEVSQLLRSPPRTLSRRRKAGKLGMGESERLLRAERIFAKLLDLLGGDREKAAAWLHSPKKALEGRTPLEFMETEPGAREVEDIIERTRYGVFG